MIINNDLSYYDLLLNNYVILMRIMNVFVIKVRIKKKGFDLKKKTTTPWKL